MNIENDGYNTETTKEISSAQEPVLNSNNSDSSRSSGDQATNKHNEHNEHNEHNVSNVSNEYIDPNVVDVVHDQIDHYSALNIANQSAVTKPHDAEKTGEQVNVAKAEESTEAVAEEAPETIKPKDTTLDNSVKRMAGNGKLRVAAIGTVSALLLLGGGSYFVMNSFSSEPDQAAISDVNVPKTKAVASAIVTPEQAEFIKQQQVKAGETAEKQGGTYIAPFVTVSNNNQEELAPPTQPGLKGPDIPNNHTFKDKDGRVYTAEQAATLQQQGVNIPGVTQGAGSISDPNLANSVRTSNKVGDTKGQKAENTKPAYEPYQVKPYSPNSTSGDKPQNEAVSTESAALDDSVKNVNDWQSQYLAMRLKKANLVNQKTQVAFVEQVGELEKTVKPTADHRATKLGTFNRNYYAIPVTQAPAVNSDRTQAQKTNTTTEVLPLIYAGETYRAILKNEVNTDNGKEVIAVLQNGPLKGSTLMGTVVPTNNNIQFNFTRLLRQGKGEISVVATARQIGTNSSGMADDIQKHYMTRYSALVASSMLSGIGKSYEQTSGTSATVTGNGAVVTNATDPTNKRILGNAVGQLGNEVSNDVKDLTKKPTTYITNSGKVFNVFFSQNVQDNKTAGKKY